MLFGWFAPAAPVGPRQKAWVEVRMGWLADEFGLDPGLYLVMFTEMAPDSVNHPSD